MSENQYQIAILRGINVGGHRKIKMADLREKLAASGLEAVKTYIQSGNILFKSAINDTNKIAKDIQQLILNEFGFEVPVIVLSATELKITAKQNPFLKEGVEDISKLHVTFLGKEPDVELGERLSPTPFLPDDFRLVAKTVYLHCPNGYGRTKLTNNFFEKKLAVAATTRNWKTINKLVELVNT